MKLEIEIPSILYQEARDNRGYISVGKMEIAWKAIADGKPIEQEPVKKLEEQIKQLQNRCHALTHGQICVYCLHECEHKAESEEEE